MRGVRRYHLALKPKYFEIPVFAPSRHWLCCPCPRTSVACPDLGLWPARQLPSAPRVSGWRGAVSSNTFGDNIHVVRAPCLSLSLQWSSLDILADEQLRVPVVCGSRR